MPVDDYVVRTTTIYDDKDYWEPLTGDVNQARGSLLFAVPYLTDNALTRWESLIKEAIRRGVAVRVLLQAPPFFAESDSRKIPAYARPKLSAFRENVQWLENLGASVEPREMIHYKFLIIDDVILWEGSLNFLSHSMTREHVRRTISWQEVEIVKGRHSLGDVGSIMPADDLALVRQAIIGRRMERGLRQTDLAKSVNAAPSEISRLENGQAKLISAVGRSVLHSLDLHLVAVPGHVLRQVRQYLDSVVGTAPAARHDAAGTPPSPPSGTSSASKAPPSPPSGNSSASKAPPSPPSGTSSASKAPPSPPSGTSSASKAPPSSSPIAK